MRQKRLLRCLLQWCAQRLFPPAGRRQTHLLRVSLTYFAIKYLLSFGALRTATKPKCLLAIYRYSIVKKVIFCHIASSKRGQYHISKILGMFRIGLGRWRKPRCMVTHKARVWINQVRLSILLVVSWTGKMNISLSAFAPEKFVSRDGFGSPLPRQPAHSILRLNLVLKHGIPPEYRGGVHLFI